MRHRRGQRGAIPRVLLALIPIYYTAEDGLAANFQDRFINRDWIPDRYNPALRELAAKRNLVLVDQYTPFLEAGPKVFYDGLHPNAAGNEIMARIWLKALLKLLPKQSGIPGTGNELYR